MCSWLPFGFPLDPLENITVCLSWLEKMQFYIFYQIEDTGQTVSILCSGKNITECKNFHYFD